MALKLDGKKAIVAELTGMADKSISVIAADYCGLTVSEMTELRVNARKAGVFMRIYRNTLARRAVEETAFACLSDSLIGPIVLFFSQDEPGAAAKLLRDFMKVHENLEVRALAMDSQLFGPDSLKDFAALPSRDEALTQLVSVLDAPVTKFVRTLAETYAQLVRVIAAVGDKKK